MTRSACTLFDAYVHRGNPVALGNLYDLVAPELLTLALHLTKNPAQAEDLVQEVFLKAMQERQSWNPNVEVESWMSLLLAETFENTRHQHSEATSFTELPSPHDLPDRHNPVTEVQEIELREQLESAIAGLPDRYRSVVRLLLQDGLSSEEVGQALQRPAATVRSQLARGLDRLRQILPTALGLAIWGSATSFGVKASAPSAPLEAMKQRFLEKAADQQDLLQASTATQWPLATKLIAVGVLALGTVYLGIQQWAKAEAPQSVANESNLAQAEPQSQISGDGSHLVTERHAPEFESAPTAAVQPMVSGIVIDAHGVPFAGARVSIYYWEPWGPEEADTRLKDVEGFGYSGITDSEGRYSIATPCLPPGEPRLFIRAGEAFTQMNLRFSSSNTRLKPFLAGDNQVPAMQLLPAGSIHGTFHMDDGTPAYPAYVEICPGIDPNNKTWHWTKKDGSVEVHHLPAGVHTLQLSFQGRVQQATIDVEAGTSTEIRNIVFPASIPILVHVVDAFGKDVEGASGRFEALNPSQTSHFPRQVSDAAGLLKMDLPTSDQHGIVIEAAGYSSEEAIYKLQPGQAQLTVRMLPVNLARIRVTDAKTGEPMVRFNMQNQIQLDGQWKEVGRIDRQRLDDEGTRSMPFLAGGRCKISRNGYKTMYLPFEAPCTGIHELSLEPVRPVVGKLLRDGKPVGGISLEVCARLVPGMQHPSILDLRGSTTDTQADLIWAQTDATGSFSFDPLEDPDFWYCLRGNDQEGHAIEHWFQVNQDDPSVFDLGDLELTPGGTLLGKVTVPDCVRPAGIVFLSDLDTGACATATDPSGRFELTNLAPGTHYLRMQATPGLAPVKREFQFTIEAGQTLEQHFDLRHLELSVRQLQISSQGSPLVNHKVFLRTGATQADWSESALFGITDANGSVAGSTLVGGFASVWVQSPAGETPRKHPTAIVPLTCHALPAIPVAY